MKKTVRQVIIIIGVAVVVYIATLTAAAPFARGYEAEREGYIRQIDSLKTELQRPVYGENTQPDECIMTMKHN